MYGQSTTADLNYQGLFRASVSAVLVALPDAPHFTIIDASESYLAITLLAREEVIGKPLRSVFPSSLETEAESVSKQEQANLLLSSLEMVLETHEADVVFPILVRTRKLNGTFEERVWSVTSIPVWKERGKIEHVLIDITNVSREPNSEELMPQEDSMKGISARSAITDLTKTNQQLNGMLRNMELVRRTKVDFLANISHEIRSPLQSIMGYTQLLQRDLGIAGDRREFVEAIMRSSQYLLDLVNDLLDASKIRAGKFGLTPIPTDLAALLKDVATIFFPRCLEKGLQFLLSFSAEIPKAVVCDPLRMRQILINLLSNAVKFTNQGSVSLEAKVIKAAPTDVSLLISVRDTGIGIAQSDVSKMFQQFEQVGPMTPGGTGLGLYIARKLAQLMNGDVQVKSEIGQGSEFSVRVVLPVVNNDTSPTKVDIVRIRSEYADQAVLVVDDTEFNRIILSRFLKDVGFTSVYTASSGMEAVSCAQSKAFTVILMDVVMPEMDGIAAARKIRLLPNYQNVPIIAVSGSYMDDSRIEECKGVFTHMMQKPLYFDDLRRALEVQCSFQFDSIEGERKGLRALVVDDQAMIRRLVSVELKRDGIDVEECSNGADAIERVKCQTFDVVLVDRVMPGMDGIETARLLSQDLHAPAIIMMSADMDKDDVVKAYAAGASAVMEKPFKAMELRKSWDNIKAARVASKV